MMIPASALGRADRPAPSERVVMGSIGVGTMGFGDMNAFMGIPAAQVVAICDVKSTMRDRASRPLTVTTATRIARRTTISESCSIARTSTLFASPRSTVGMLCMP